MIVWHACMRYPTKATEMLGTATRTRHASESVRGPVHAHESARGMRKPSGEPAATSARALGCFRLHAGAQVSGMPAQHSPLQARRAAQRRLE
eukprot:5642719-Prymnesium_polylepis.2